MNNLKELINYHLFDKITDKTSVAVLFSGGTDSLTCLFSLMELGIKPTLYSFHLENTIHRDIEISKQVAEYYELNHVIIEIKRDITQLQNDVKYLIETFKISRKTNVQCTYPFLHVLPQIKEKFIVSGLCADDLYGTAKSVAIKGGKDKVVLDDIRRKTLSSLDSSAYKSIKELVENVHEKVFITPYRSQEVIDYMFQFSWAEMNKPKQKQIAYSAYQYYFEKQNIYRKNTNLQVGSKIREWHSELVNTELNKNDRHRVDEIYKDIARELKIL
jgi:asparagine synthetase B (glutamine-hydrolysing)